MGYNIRVYTEDELRLAKQIYIKYPDVSITKFKDIYDRQYLNKPITRYHAKKLMEAVTLGIDKPLRKPIADTHLLTFILRNIVHKQHHHIIKNLIIPTYNKYKGCRDSLAVIRKNVDIEFKNINKNKDIRTDVYKNIFISRSTSLPNLNRYQSDT